MRRRTTVLLSGLVLSTVLAANASAAPPAALDSYAAGGTTVALDLDAPVLQLRLTAAQTAATLGSTGPTAAADGIALTTPLFSTDAAPVAAPPGPASADVCASDVTLPAPIDLLTLPIACVHTDATVTDPASSSLSDELVLGLGGGELTNQVLTPLVAPVFTPVLDGLGQLGDLIQLETLVDEVLDSLVEPDGELLRITVAPNLSETSANAASGVVAHAISQGAVIEVLPELPNGAFITITVGQAEARVVRADAETGELTPTVTPAVVNIEFNTIDIPTLTITLGGLQVDIPTVTQQIEDAVNGLVQQLATQSPLTCSGDNPLADLVCLTAASGETLDAAGAAAEGFDFGAGTVGARANALHVELLRAAEGGITLDLAQAVAAANAGVDIPRQEPGAPDTTTTTAGPPSLARTGGGAVSPMAAVLLLGAGLGAAVLVRRARPTLG